MADVTVKYKGNTIAEMSGAGSKTLKTSGKYCEGDIGITYTPPDQPVMNFKTYEITLEHVGGWVYIVTLDDEIMEHVDDPTFTVQLGILDDYTYVFYTSTLFIATNTAKGSLNGYPVYGLANRQASETLMQFSGVFYPANNRTTDTSLGGYGMFRLDGNRYYLRPGDGGVRPGRYRLIFTW